MGIVESDREQSDTGGLFTGLLEITLILFSLDGRLWVKHDAESSYVLPRLPIPKWTRVARETIRAAESILGIKIFCLWQIREREKVYVVARIENPDGLASDWRGFAPAEFGDCLSPSAPLCLVNQAYREAFLSHERSCAELFKRIDWDRALADRLRPFLEKQGLELTGEMEQLNASETFALMKLHTTGEPLWFKAVGAPNLAEYSVTTGLHRLFPQLMPPILAEFPDWHGWVAEDSRGARLDASTEPDDWKLAAATLAQYQVASLPHIGELLQMGCTDCRALALASHLENFVEAMHQAMAEDIGRPILRLDLYQIQEVAEAVRSSLAEMEEHDLPSSLVHRDLSGGNLQILPAGCYFIDWAQACISHPFICLEYMKVHLATALKEDPDRDLRLAELGDAYAAAWSEVLTAEQLGTARKHAALLAEYLYVLPMDGRTSLDLLDTRESRAMMRSMVRRMWRELQGSSETAPTRIREQVHA